MSTERKVVIGVGLSSKADAAEVRLLVENALADRALGLDDVATIATRSKFTDDPRLHLGPPVIGYPDEVLEEKSAPCERTVGIRARVAETAAMLASGVDPGAVDALWRSAHVSVALVVT